MQLVLPSPWVAARLEWRVEGMEWRAQGGPYRLRTRAALSPAICSLGSGLCDGLLGQPVSVIDGDGAPCWWGYVHSATLEMDGLAQRLSLEGLANRAACLYPRPDGVWAQTAWAEDAASVECWGAHERLLRLPVGGEGEALSARDALLSHAAQPRRTAALHPAADEAALSLEARGWWETLAWTFFAPAGGRVEWAAGGGAGQPVGMQAGNTRVAQSFRLAGESWPAGEAWLRVGKRGAPADALRLELCGDAGGAPGALLASSEVGAAAVPNAAGWLRFALDNPPLVADSNYWLALRRTGGLDAANYFCWQADEEAGYPEGECRLWDGGDWSLRQPPADLGFRVNGVRPAGEQIALLVARNVFLIGARLDDEGSLAALRWRDGRRTCLEELEELLSAGGWLAEVEPDRVLGVRRRPLENEIEGALRDGKIVGRGGLPWPVSRPLAGRWLRAGEAAVWAGCVAWEKGVLRVE